ncbi:MAG: peptide ABC transporter substrate-binding protein, partial [Pseudomonadota bacterium]
MKLKSLLLGAVATGLGTMAFADGHATRGSDGEVRILYWQAPSILNPFLSGGTKDVESASLVLEPLARYNETGALVPWLVDEVPTVGNGGVSADLTQITWVLSEG